METKFEIKESGERDWPFSIVQLKRTAYYEDVVNPSKYRDSITCMVKTEEMANKLLKIFSDNPLTSEWLNDNRQLHKRFEVCNGARSYTKYKVFSSSESLVTHEFDLYNGTDQSMKLFQLMKDSKGKYSSKSPKVIICRYWDSNYVPLVIEKHCLSHKSLVIQ